MAIVGLCIEFILKLYENVRSSFTKSYFYKNDITNILDLQALFMNWHQINMTKIDMIMTKLCYCMLSLLGGRSG